MERTRIQTTREFYEIVRQYQKAHNLRSWSFALLQLAAIGYRVETGKEPPPVANDWGGNHNPHKPTS